MTFYFGIFAVVAVVNLSGNLLVLRTIYRHRCLWLPCNVFVCSLAVSDALFGVMFPVYNVSGINTPAVNQALGQWTTCRLVLMEVLALEICSAYSLVAITTCRYICTACPLRYHHYVTSRRCLAAVITLWVTSHLACGIVYASKDPRGEDGEYCRVCRYETVYTVREFGVMIVVQFGVPLSLMLACYLRMACIARKLNNRVSMESFCSNDAINQRPRSVLNQRRHRSFVIITILIGCFAVSYLPMMGYFVMVIAKREPRTQHEYFSAASRIFLFLNTAVNVFIYAGRMSDFRECLRRDVNTFLLSLRQFCSDTTLGASLCHCVSRFKMTSPPQLTHVAQVESEISSTSSQV